MRSSESGGQVSPFAGMDVATMLASLADGRGGHPMLVWAPHEGEGRVWTYAAFLHEVRCVAGGLAARGIAQGDRVLVHLENAPETLIARFACAWIGAVCVVTNAMATGPELASLADTVGARAAITQPSLVETLAAHVRGLDWIAVTETDAGRLPSSKELPRGSDRFAALRAEPAPMRAPDPSLPAMILFTTGTTARAKAVLWTHENMLWAACLGSVQQRFAPADVTQLFLPLFHVVGFSWAFLSAIWCGGTVVLQPRFSASRFWPVATAHRATVAAHVPFTISALTQQEQPPHHFRQWLTNRQMPREQARFAVPRFSSAWGMTEMIAQPVIGDPDIGPLAADTVGRVSPGYEVRIVDERGGLAAPGESGELLVRGVRGRSIFLEYFGDAKGTHDAFDSDGFFCSGDRVRHNEDGTITFIDRLKDVIKVGGEGVAAGEIEAVIQAVQGVKEVAVVAGPDPLRTEVPVAFVVCAEGSAQPALRDAIEGACRSALARFKVPQRILFVDKLPRVGFGKIAKVSLRARASEALQQPAGAA